MSEQFLSYLYPVSLTLVFAIGGIVSFKRIFGQNRARKYLALMFWSYFLALFNGYALNSGLMYSLPHLFRTGHAATLVFMPLSYLYISFSLEPGKWRAKNLLHFIPVVIFLIDYAVFFAKPAVEKLAVYEAAVGTPMISDLAEGSFIPGGIHVLSRYLLMVGYWVAQVLCIRKAYKSASSSLAPNDVLMYRWFKWLSAIQLIIILPPLVNLLIPFEQVRVLNQFSAILASLTLGYFLFSRPEILYGFSRFAIPDKRITKDFKKEKNIESGRIPALEGIGQIQNADMDGFTKKLENHFNKNRSYLNQSYNLRILAGEMNCTPNKLSYLINHYYGINFNTLINRQRIAVCREKLQKKENLHKTLEAIGQEAGFKSRSTFIKAFKEETGLTPTAYIRNTSEDSV